MPALWYSLPGPGTTRCLPHSLGPEQAHTEAFQEKAAATPDTTAGHLCQRAPGAPAMEEVSSSKWVSETHSGPAQQPTAAETQTFRPSLPFSSSEKGEKVTSLLLGSQSEMDHRRAQHWSKVIYNQEKGRKPLLLEAASHCSVQLHTAQKSNYTNTLCKVSHKMCIPVNKIQLHLLLATPQLRTSSLVQQDF